MKKILVILVSSILPLFVSAYDFEFNGMYFNYLELVGQEQDDGIATYICNVELTNKEGGMGGSFVQTQVAIWLFLTLSSYQTVPYLNTSAM